MIRWTSFKPHAVAISLLMPFTLVCAQAARPSPEAVDSPAASMSSTAEAWVKVQEPWIRPTVKGQTATGGFMVLTARQTLKLEGFAMDSQGVPELHEMTMDGNVMRMRAVRSLSLPAGKAVALRPGGHHLMLTQLSAPLKEGDEVPLTLHLRTEDGRSIKQTVKMPVRSSSEATDHPAMHDAHTHHGGHMHH